MSRRDEPPFTLPEIAARWKCSRQHVHNMVRRGELSVIRLGKLVRVTAEEVERCESCGSGESGTPHGPKEGCLFVCRSRFGPSSRATGMERDECLT